MRLTSCVTKFSIIITRVYISLEGAPQKPPPPSPYLPVLGSIVLILILADKTAPGEVIGPSLATAPVLDLEPFKVGLVLDNLDESHGDSFGYGANGTKVNASTGTLLSTKTEITRCSMVQINDKPIMRLFSKIQSL